MQLVGQSTPMLMTPLLPLMSLNLGPMKLLQGLTSSVQQWLCILPRSLGLIRMVHCLISVWFVLQLFLDPTCRTLWSTLLNSLCSPLQLPIMMQAPLPLSITLTMPLVPLCLQYYL